MEIFLLPLPLQQCCCPCKYQKSDWSISCEVFPFTWPFGFTEWWIFPPKVLGIYTVLVNYVASECDSAMTHRTQGSSLLRYECVDVGRESNGNAGSGTESAQWVSFTNKASQTHVGMYSHWIRFGVVGRVKQYHEKSHSSCRKSHSSKASLLILPGGPPIDIDKLLNLSFLWILHGRLFGYGSTIVGMTTLAGLGPATSISLFYMWSCVCDRNIFGESIPALQIQVAFFSVQTWQ